MANDACAKTISTAKLLLIGLIIHVSALNIFTAVMDSREQRIVQVP